ncbi:unnamed protein product [Ambrosiozyma monospora]|uniref:Unnamed protein product n=1 Tax=Ambrosiozyma monospora TaxID=43982 RepID=A0A9W7DEY1_AMBMO|nr:unnamed protein product [Ambrosiozyma monospora]
MTEISNDQNSNPNLNPSIFIVSCDQQLIGKLKEQLLALKPHVAILPLKSYVEWNSHLLNDRSTSVESTVSKMMITDQRTTRLTTILEFDAYWQNLKEDLKEHGYTESIEKIDHDIGSRLANPAEEKYLRSVLQDTINYKVLNFYKAKTMNSNVSPIELLRWLKENREYILKQERVMNGLRVEKGMTIKDLRHIYLSIQNKLVCDLSSELLKIDELVLKYAYKSLQNSARYSGWAQQYAEDRHLCESEVHLTFSSVTDLFDRAKPAFSMQYLVETAGVYVLSWFTFAKELYLSSWVRLSLFVRFVLLKVITRIYC